MLLCMVERLVLEALPTTINGESKTSSISSRDLHDVSGKNSQKKIALVKLHTMNIK